VDWIRLAEDRDKWRSLLNAVMNLWVPQNAGKLWSAAHFVASRVLLRSIQLVS
jgi:hypothetical protein